MEKEQLISLVTKAQSGDNDALNQLFSEYYNDLYYFALKTVKDDQLAFDVTQEAFVDILNHIDSLKEPSAFVSWAKQITYHQCTRHFRKHKDVIVDEDEDGNTIFDDIKEESADFIPDEALDRDDFKRTILSMIDTLSPEQRSAVMMYYFDELSVAQIAEIQGVSEGTVKSRLNYARKAIKAEVEEYEKKNNIKLHAFPFFPFLRFIFTGDKQSVAKTMPAIQNVLPATMSAASSAAATTTAAQAAGSVVSRGVAGKIVAAVLAGAIAIGGATTAIIMSKNNSSNSGNNKAKSTAVSAQEKPEYEIIGYEQLRQQALRVTNSGEFVYDEYTPDSIGVDESYLYLRPSSEYNLLAYDPTCLTDTVSIKKIGETGWGVTYHTALTVVYKIPCKDSNEAIQLMKQDVAKIKQVMSCAYNGNTVSPDYSPEITDAEYESASSGLYVLMVTFGELVKIESGFLSGSEISESTAQFKFTCIEEDGTLYYCPKIVFDFKDNTSGKWEADYRSGLTLMEY